MVKSPPENCAWVATENLRRYNPLDRKFWIDQVVSTDQVIAALIEGRLLDRPVGLHDDREYQDPQAHAARVAFFVQHGLSDQDFLEIDVGVPELNCFVREPVQDGNHRLAAALIRGDEWVACSIGGSETLIRKLFGRAVARELFQEARAA